MTMPSLSTHVPFAHKVPNALRHLGYVMIQKEGHKVLYDHFMNTLLGGKKSPSMVFERFKSEKMAIKYFMRCFLSVIGVIERWSSKTRYHKELYGKKTIRFAQHLPNLGMFNHEQIVSMMMHSRSMMKKLKIIRKSRNPSHCSGLLSCRGSHGAT